MSLQWCNQNRRLKVLNRGIYVCAGGTVKFGQSSTNLYCFLFQFWGVWSFVWGVSPSRGDVLGSRLVTAISMHLWTILSS